MRGARYQPSPVETELRRLEDLEPGITDVGRSPLGEVLMPRAARAAIRLAKLGRPVKIMAGGVTGWIDEGYGLDKARAAA